MGVERDSMASSEPSKLCSDSSAITQSEHSHVNSAEVGTFRFWTLKLRRLIGFFLFPLLFLPLPLVTPGNEAKAAYIILVLASYWIMEIFPIEVTALLPIVLFPLFGVLTPKEVSEQYLADNNIIFLGGLIMAVAIEHWNLHKRVALKVLLMFGTKPERLLLGFMMVTAFISMFVSDTATAAMMMPIGEAVLTELEAEEDLITGEIVTMDTYSGSFNPTPIICDGDERDPLVTPKTKTAALHNFPKGLLLAIAYSALIGGTATLTGTGPNIVLSGQLDRLFKNGPRMTYFSWSVFAFPQMLILLIVAWFYISVAVVRVSFVDLLCCCARKSITEDRDKRALDVIKKQYSQLGPMKFAEKLVLVHFVTLVLLWLLREPKVFPGWSAAFRSGYVSDGTTALLVTLLLFIVPSEKPSVIFRSRSEECTRTPPDALLTWDVLVHKLPWGIVLLLGSGYAIAGACEKSGLSRWIGTQLLPLGSLPSYVVVLLSCAMVTIFTEISSNTATATIFLPILASLAVSIKVHPWYLMIPATISASFAFMLPISTPPNAIAFSTGRLRVVDMVKFGVGLDIIGLVILSISINTFGSAYYGFDRFPDWARHHGSNLTQP